MSTWLKGNCSNSVSPVTWGVTRTPEGPRCTVFCHVCRMVFGRDLSVTEARELRETALALHTEGVCKENATNLSTHPTGGLA